MKTTKQHLKSKGKFGDFGGQFVPETLMFALEELEESYKKYITNNDFLSALNNLDCLHRRRNFPRRMSSFHFR